MLNEFKTKGGTILPLMDLKGQKYLKVQHRLVWFREECPTYSIQTSIIDSKDGFIVKAVISDDKGFVLAEAHKWSGKSQFPLECAETGAIGRCLALLGYGTAFTADELDEKEELADAPIGVDKVCEVCNATLFFSDKKRVWYCPNFNDRSKGEHTYVKE